MTPSLWIAAIKRWLAHLLRKGVGAVTSPSATVAYGALIPGIRRSERKVSSEENMPNVLVLRTDGIGDVIMTGPLLRELKRAHPDARIELVVAPRALNFVELCPYVDKVFTVEIPPPISVDETWWRPLTRRLEALSVARRHLWPQEYDVAIVPRWGVDQHEASVLAYLSGAPTRVAYSEHVSLERRTKNRGYDRFFTRAIDDRSIKHEVQRNLDVLAALGNSVSESRLEAWTSDDDEDFARNILPSDRTTPLVALGPGAGHPKRVWPIDRFVRVGSWLIDRGAGLVVVGGQGEQALGHELRRRLGGGVVDLTNTTTLRQSVAVLRQCSLFCGNDGGPMHLAAAAGIPVVEISCHARDGDDLHANSPIRFGPWGVPNKIVRPERLAERCLRGCRIHAPHCILNVDVDSVTAAIEALIVETAATADPSTAWTSLDASTMELE